MIGAQSAAAAAPPITLEFVENAHRYDLAEIEARCRGHLLRGRRSSYKIEAIYFSRLLQQVKDAGLCEAANVPFAIWAMGLWGRKKSQYYLYMKFRVLDPALVEAHKPTFKVMGAVADGPEVLHDFLFGLAKEARKLGRVEQRIGAAASLATELLSQGLSLEEIQEACRRLALDEGDKDLAGQVQKAKKLLGQYRRLMGEIAGQVQAGAEPDAALDELWANAQEAHEITAVACGKKADRRDPPRDDSARAENEGDADSDQGLPGDQQGPGAAVIPPVTPPPAPPAAPPQTQPPAQEEDWQTPVTKAVVAHLLPEEAPLLERHLLLALCNKPPAELLSFIRTVAGRMTDVPQPVREDLGCWLRAAAHWDPEVRWHYIYNFFIVAQMPDFRIHLHGLATLDLQPSARQLLEVACAHFPLEVPPEGRPLPEPKSELDAVVLSAVEGMRLERWCYERLKEAEGDVNAEILAALWCEAVDRKKLLTKLKQYLPDPE